MGNGGSTCRQASSRTECEELMRDEARGHVNAIESQEQMANILPHPYSREDFSLLGITCE